jgi:cytochrome c oxidase assembly protein subunit 15
MDAHARWWTSARRCACCCWPALALAAAGLGVAAPSRRHAAPPAGALTRLTLFLTFDLVVFGAFTRLTDSGLGCPDWPGCYGTPARSARNAEIAQAERRCPGAR